MIPSKNISESYSPSLIKINIYRIAARKYFYGIISKSKKHMKFLFVYFLFYSLLITKPRKYF